MVLRRVAFRMRYSSSSRSIDWRSSTESRPPQLRSARSPGLIRYGLCRRRDGIGITQVFRPQWAQLRIEFVYPRHARGNIELRNRPVRNVLEHLHQRPQAVPMSRDQNVAAGHQRRRDSLLPARPHTNQGRRQRFRGWQQRCVQPPIAWIEPWMPIIVHINGRRRNIVRPAPYLHLICTVTRRPSLPCRDPGEPRNAARSAASPDAPVST